MPHKSRASISLNIADLSAAVINMTDEQAGQLLKAFCHVNGGRGFDKYSVSDPVVSCTLGMFVNRFIHNATVSERRKQAARCRWHPATPRDPAHTTIVDSDASLSSTPTPPPPTSAATKHSRNIFVPDLSFVPAEHMEVFQMWIDYKRKSSHSYTTQIGVETCYRKLIRQTGGNVQLMRDAIEESIGNNYQGIFPNKNNATNQYQRQVQARQQLGQDLAQRCAAELQQPQSVGKGQGGFVPPSL